ncbi:two-component response regulator-like APRR1 isoform X2 [Diospyros lotus]|uniref:two-component response regulator-like APRR1 isoform X2 n=1 Tax=Diospyros lotus TaxID=55363 RepID=UPI0022513B35|nr:two-component response regulator-like APRR1 isoform X2 [Diospyros lotus]
MDGDDIAADKDWGGSGGKSSDSFIDRSKVRILMCDNDAKSSKEAFTLLCKCSYQVTSVRSARQVIDALNAEGPDIDIILSEVDLPMAKGLKMLKYIMRDKELQRIPVIMMSAQDEVSIVVKCLRLGAADYLVKPLRTNELLNLWTHMWRRRQMLGLLEKKIMNFDFDLVASDPSDANTNSTTLFSDDTDDKSKKNANPELCMSTHQEEEVNVVERQIMSNSGITAAPVDPPPVVSLDYGPEVLGTSNRQTGQFSSCPKKSELRIGGSSAFFSYVKHSMPKSNAQVVVPAAETASLELRIKQRLETWSGQTCRDTINLEKHMGNGAQNHEKREVKENHSPGDDFPSSCSIRDSLSMDRSSTPPVLTESTHCSNSTKEDFSQAHVHLRNVSHHDVRAIHAHTAYPYYISGMMNQIMMPSSQMYQKNLQDLPAHAASTLLPQFGHVPQVPHVPGMASYPYYPVGICMQPGQMPGASPWPLYGSSTTAEEKLGKVGRREAALIKFRQKRKERCFDKKIRYVNRKRLAERRPRVRGQFVRKINGINVDLNGQPASLDYDVEEEEDEYEEDSGARDSFPEDEEDNAATDPSTFQS